MKYWYLGMMLFMAGATAAQDLVIHKVDGSEVVIKLADIDCITFTGMPAAPDYAIKNANAPKTFNLNMLTYSQLIYTGYGIAPDEPYFPHDDQGIVLFQYNGQDYYHPLTIAQRMFHFIDSYMQTNDPKHYERTELFARKLGELAVEYKGALFYKIDFDWPLHEIQTEVMKAPWYSGIVQGRILSIFSRMYMASADADYLELSRKVFNSYKILREPGQAYDDPDHPWVACIDDSGYYWLEEYPFTPITNVLNGFIVGIFGLYDYYLITHDPEVKYYLDLNLTTLQHYMPQFRQENGLSYYCLRHKIQYKEYHEQHMLFLNKLYDMTSDPYFKEMADLLYQDYH